MTGADRIPPLGFSGGIGIRFLHEQERILPVASTCGPYISLPTCHRVYDDFKGAMLEGIVSGFGLGLVKIPCGTSHILTLSLRSFTIVIYGIVTFNTGHHVNDLSPPNSMHLT